MIVPEWTLFPKPFTNAPDCPAAPFPARMSASAPRLTPPDSWSVAPKLTVVGPLEPPKAEESPATSIPAATVIVPERELAPAKVSEPVPFFVKLPAPASEPPKIRFSTPTSTTPVMLVGMGAKRGLKSATTPGPYCNVPPQNETGPMFPRASFFPILKMPASRLVPPV